MTKESDLIQRGADAISAALGNGHLWLSQTATPTTRRRYHNMSRAAIRVALDAAAKIADDETGDRAAGDRIRAMLP